MAIRLHLLEDMLNFSIWADDEGGAGDAHDLFTVHVLFLENAICYRDFLLGIGQ